MLKKNEVIVILEKGGHIGLSDIYRSATVYDVEGNEYTCRYDTAEKIGKMEGFEIISSGAWTYYRTVRKTPVTPKKKTYHHPQHPERIFTAREAASLHRSGRDILTSTGVLIHGKPQETEYSKNRAHCRSIANDLEDYASGRVYRCPECNEIITLPDDVGDKYKCPDCDTVHDLDDLEQLSLYDYFEDCLDVEYRVGSDKQYRSVCIMVTCGGPNIYIDTASKRVELYWWGDRADYLIDDDTINEIDAWAEEYWECL